MRYVLRLHVLVTAYIAPLFLAGTLQAEEVLRMGQREPPKAGSAVAVSVNKAIDQWEASTAVAVTPRARGLIAAQLSGFASKSVSDVAASFLTTAYLYELRDSKGVSGNPPINLDVADMSRYPLARLATQAAFEKGMGYLKCSSSDPKGGKILIDGEAKGNTVKTFVLSTGMHTVVIALEKENCQNTIMIEKDHLTESECPKAK